MLAKKGSRGLLVDGENYRWKANNKCGHLLVAVQKPESNGQMLIVTIAHDLWDMDQCDKAVGPVTPKLVMKLIKFGLEKGWHPDSSNGNLELECPAGFHENL